MAPAERQAEKLPCTTLGFFLGHITQHWVLSWAVSTGVLLLDERCLMTSLEEQEFEVQGQVFYLFLLMRNKYVCLCVYTRTVLTRVRGRRRRERGENENYLLFLFYFIYYNRSCSFLLSLMQLCSRYSVCGNNMIVLLANVKFNCCKQWLKDCCTETGDFVHSYLKWMCIFLNHVLAK